MSYISMDISESIYSYGIQALLDEAFRKLEYKIEHPHQLKDREIIKEKIKKLYDIINTT